tara:strand:- start:6060 stop:6173 length:114 start_codon:yes stop_codon:yes gene_type:complete
MAMEEGGAGLGWDESQSLRVGVEAVEGSGGMNVVIRR